MNIRPLLLSLIVLSVSSLAFAQDQQQAATPKPTPPTAPTVARVFTYGNDRLCSPKCQAGIGNKIIVQIENPDPAKYPPKDLVLFLDGQPIKGNAGDPVRGGELYPAAPPDAYLVEFQLNRTDESRATWAALLGSPSLTKPRRTVTVSAGKPTEQPFAYDLNNKPQIELRSYYQRWFIAMLLCVLAAVIVFVYLARTTNIIRDSNPPEPAEGTRKPYSLALAQAAFWFFLVFGSYLFIALVTGDYNSSITEQALILMGIGTGTALGAAMIDSSKIGSAKAALSTLEPKQAQLEEQKKQLTDKINSLSASTTPADQQTVADAKVQLKDVEAQLEDNTAQIKQAREGLSKPISEGFTRDLLTDADGVNFHRFQMVIWTIIIGCLFVYGVYKALAMPDFSATLLALMGISSGTYLGFKIPEKQN
jgi:hypothetical protein